MKVISGRKKMPSMIMIYGPQGSGKTSLAADWDDDVLMFSGMSGDSELNVKRYCFDEKTERCYAQTWEEILKGANDLVANAGKLKTVCFDELGIMQRRCEEYLCTKHKWAAVSQLGFGKGEGVLCAEMRLLRKAIDELRGKGVNILFTLHATEAKSPNPKGPDFKKFAPALTSVGEDGRVREEFTGPCDAVLFLTLEIETKTIGEDIKKKTLGVGTGRRLLYTQEDDQAWFQAKNRYKNVDPVIEIPFDRPFSKFKHQMAEGQSVSGMAAKIRRIATERQIDPDLAKKTLDWLASDAAKDLGALLNMAVFLNERIDGSAAA